MTNRGAAAGPPPSPIPSFRPQPRPVAAMTATTHFAFLLLRDFSHLAFSCALEPLRIANLVSGRPLYRWSLISADGKASACSNGTVTLADAGLEPTKGVDRLFVISGINMQAHCSA